MVSYEIFDVLSTLLESNFGTMLTKFSNLDTDATGLRLVSVLV